jgi:hypothetical protein
MPDEKLVRSKISFVYLNTSLDAFPDKVRKRKARRRRSGAPSAAQRSKIATA